MQKRIFVSGHADLTFQEFEQHYAMPLVLARDASFLVGDADGADRMAQIFLHELGAEVTVYHMFRKPRNNVYRFRTCGGYCTPEARDAAMTESSSEDIAYVRPGWSNSAPARNLVRRKKSPNPIADLRSWKASVGRMGKRPPGPKAVPNTFIQECSNRYPGEILVFGDGGLVHHGFNWEAANRVRESINQENPDSATLINLTPPVIRGRRGE